MAASAGGEEALAAAQRLTAPLESAAVRLTLLDALSAAAADHERARTRFGRGAPAGASRNSWSLPPAETASDRTDDQELTEAGARAPQPPRPARRDRADQPAAPRPAQESGGAKRRPRGSGRLTRGFVRAAAAAVDRGQLRAQREHLDARSAQRYTGWGDERRGRPSRHEPTEQTNHPEEPAHVSLRNTTTNLRRARAARRGARRRRGARTRSSRYDRATCRKAPT